MLLKRVTLGQFSLGRFEMVDTIIESFPKEKREARSDGSSILNISECFANTIQGEGKYVGVPATFLRLQGCTLACNFCDSLEVWKKGNPYSVLELIELLTFKDVTPSLKDGQHLVITGGSPLKQELAVRKFIDAFMSINSFLPHIEIENEAVLFPTAAGILNMVYAWNNSPKLSNSGMPVNARYKPEILSQYSKLSNVSWKFVVSNKDDWDEIKKDFIDTGFVNKRNLILMPEGVTREQLQDKYQWLVDLCCKENVRMTDRLHVTVWNKKTGV